MNKIKPVSNRDQSLSVIRVNCIENTPSAIEDIFVLSSHSLLALTRSDNSIELWSSDNWIQLLKIPGMKSLQTRRVFLLLKSKSKASDGLVRQIRLFTSGLNGYLIEWDLIKLKPLFSYKNPGGCIWDAKQKGKLCLLGTNDGTPKIVKLKSNSPPYLLSQFAKSDSRILSVCWEDNKESSNFYTGHSNGTIMKWSLKNGQVLLSINTNNPDGLIWALLSVKTNHLLCGDSSGRLLIYDMTFGILVKEFKEHNADIMTIVKNSSIDNPCVYFTGIDSLVCSLQLNTKSNEWLLTSSFRGQSHDINALALLNNDYLISGGVTTDICIYHIINGCLYQQYDKKASTNVKRHISPFDQRPKYTCAYINDKTILILHQQIASCDLWLINTTQTVFLAKITPKSNNDYNVLSSAINSNGKQIAMSYNDVTVLFNYDIGNNEIKKVKSFEFQSNFIYIEDTSLICLSQAKGAIYLCEEANVKSEIKIKRNISVIACHYANCNSNGRLIAYSTIDKEVFITNLDTKTVNTLPHPDSLITQIKFICSDEVVMISDDNKLFVVNLRLNNFNQWTINRIEMNDYPLNYLSWFNKIFGIVIVDNSKLVLYTDYNYIIVDFNKEIPKECVIEKQRMEKYINSEWDKLIKEYHQCLFENEYKSIRNKSLIAHELFGKETAAENGSRRKEAMIQNDNFKIVSRYNSIMLMERLPNKQLLVIENDWNRIIKSFPGSVIKKKYGR